MTKSKQHYLDAFDEQWSYLFALLECGKTRDDIKAFISQMYDEINLSAEERFANSIPAYKYHDNADHTRIIESKEEKAWNDATEAFTKKWFELSQHDELIQGETESNCYCHCHVCTCNLKDGCECPCDTDECSHCRKEQSTGVR